MLHRQLNDIDELVDDYRSDDTVDASVHTNAMAPRMLDGWMPELQRHLLVTVGINKDEILNTHPMTPLQHTVDMLS